MNAIYLMIPIALILGFGFVGTFIYFAVRGEYDDLQTPAYKILIDESQVVPLVVTSNVSKERQET